VFQKLFTFFKVCSSNVSIYFRYAQGTKATTGSYGAARVLCLKTLRGIQYQAGENVKLVWADTSTIS